MEEQPIIVIKRKSSHGAHHGGAWKVAYADFVTAMMSLFAHRKDSRCARGNAVS